MSEKVLVDRELLNDLVSSLDGEVESRYSNGIKDHPAMRRDYECDIEPVIRGKELLAAPAAPVADGTTSDKYRAELYDEVWQRARDMGYGNVTDALVELERLKASAPAVQNAEIMAALDYSRNFASSKPGIGRTEKEHILGLVSLLERVAAHPDAALVEALRNMLAAFDNPIARRKLGGEFSQQAIESARAALAGKGATK